MNLLKTLRAALLRAAQLVYQGNDLSVRSGVWVTRISRGAVVAQFLLVAVVFGAHLLVWWFGGRTEKQWMGCVLLMITVPVAVLGTAFAHALDKHPDRPPSLQVFMLWAGLTALASIPLGHLIFFASQQVQTISKVSSLLRWFPEFLVVTLVGFSYWRLMIIRLWYERLATEELKRHSAEQAQALAEAQLQMLQAQIEPHFLFNTLASVQHLVRSDPGQAEFLLARLNSYLRQAIPGVRGTGSTLGREFDSIQTYLDIVRVRMGGRLTVSVRLDPALADTPFPALVIHTLVENAVKHGVEMKTGAVSIAVEARQGAHGAIDLSVQDDGAGFGAMPAVSGGVGLKNIRDRLALAYAGRARLDIADAPGGGVRASVSIAGAPA
jgi:hypothetical protein